MLLILLLILGGLGYAIYRVVINDSQKTKSTKMKGYEQSTKDSVMTTPVFSRELKTSTIFGMYINIKIIMLFFQLRKILLRTEF